MAEKLNTIRIRVGRKRARDIRALGKNKKFFKGRLGKQNIFEIDIKDTPFMFFLKHSIKL